MSEDSAVKIESELLAGIISEDDAIERLITQYEAYYLAEMLVDAWTDIENLDNGVSKIDARRLR